MDSSYINAAGKLRDLNRGRMTYLFPLDRDGDIFLVTNLDLAKACIPRGYSFDTKSNLYRSLKGPRFALPVVLLEDVLL